MFIFMLYCINRKNMNESNAGVLYIEKILKLSAFLCVWIHSYCLFLACSSMLFVLITAGCNPCKESKLFKMGLALCPQTVHLWNELKRFVNLFEKQTFLEHLTGYFQGENFQETVEGMSSATLADLHSLRCSSPIRISICFSFDKSVFWGCSF